MARFNLEKGSADVLYVDVIGNFKRYIFLMNCQIGALWNNFTIIFQRDIV